MSYWSSVMGDKQVVCWCHSISHFTLTVLLFITTQAHSHCQDHHQRVVYVCTSLGLRQSICDNTVRLCRCNHSRCHCFIHCQAIIDRLRCSMWLDLFILLMKKKKKLYPTHEILRNVCPVLEVVPATVAD